MSLRLRSRSRDASPLAAGRSARPLSARAARDPPAAGSNPEHGFTGPVLGTELERAASLASSPRCAASSK
eukprot:15064403-Alexandrium_andersonii.AAC.1